jgi:hypothetical protein
MLRAVLSTLLALIVGSVLISLVQSLGHVLYPFPGELDLNDSEALAKVIAQAPLGALLMVELAYVVGCFAAGALVVRLAPGFGLRLPVIVGALFTLVGALNLLAFTHPLWFAVLTTVTYIPMSVLGAKALGEGAGAKNA